MALRLWRKHGPTPETERADVVALIWSRSAVGYSVLGRAPPNAPPALLAARIKYAQLSVRCMIAPEERCVLTLNWR